METRVVFQLKDMGMPVRPCKAVLHGTAQFVQISIQLFVAFRIGAWRQAPQELQLSKPPWANYAPVL